MGRSGIILDGMERYGMIWDGMEWSWDGIVLYGMERWKGISCKGDRLF